LQTTRWTAFWTSQNATIRDDLTRAATVSSYLAVRRFEGSSPFASTTSFDAGVPYRTVADLLGNSEVTLRLHYEGRSDTGKRDAVKALRADAGLSSAGLLALRYRLGVAPGRRPRFEHRG
jgi:hypothetical protein